MFYVRGSALKAGLGALALLCSVLTGCGGGSSTSIPAKNSASGSSALGIVVPSPVAGNVKKSLASTSYSSTVLQDGPAAYYQLNDASSTLTDSGPTGVNGTYGSSVNHQGPALTIGAASASTFPGGSSYNTSGFAYTVPNSVLQPATITLEAWVQCNAANTTGKDIPIVVYGDEKSGVRYGLSLHDATSTSSDIVYTQKNLNQTYPVLTYTATRLTVGSTYHIVAVSDGTHVTTYVNGLVDQSVSYPGSVDYTPVFSNGLQIGGAWRDPVNGSAPFPGTIAQVAVYGKALSQTQVVNHFLAGEIVPMVSESATQADAFVDSIGVNTHFENQYSVYGTQFSQVAGLLESAGIRHIRAGMLLANAQYYSNMKQLAAAGVRANYITALTTTQADLTNFATGVGSSLEQYEAPNEQDDQQNPNWVVDCQQFQKNLYAWVKGSSQLASIPVLGPALTSQTSYTQLGDLSSYMDIANIHDYFANHNPGNPGYGSNQPPYGIYGSIAYNVNLVKVTGGSNPPMATETGYATGTGYQNVDYATDLRYITRLLFEQVKGGITRSYPYELIDNSAAPFMGLLQNNLAPKPSYTGVKSIIAALNDPGPAFTPATLTYRLSGFTNNVHHLFLQKRNGTVVLAIWIETPSWNTVSGGDIVVPPQSVTLQTQNSFSSSSLAVMDETGAMSTSTLPWSPLGITFNVTDKVSFVNLMP